MIAAGGKLRHDVFHSALAVVRDSVQYDAVGHNFHATPFKPQYPHRGRHAAVPAPGYGGTVTIIALFGADFQIYFSQSAGPGQTKKLQNARAQRAGSTPRRAAPSLPLRRRRRPPAASRRGGFPNFLYRLKLILEPSCCKTQSFISQPLCPERVCKALMPIARGAPFLFQREFVKSEILTLFSYTITDMDFPVRPTPFFYKS